MCIELTPNYEDKRDFAASYMIINSLYPPPLRHTCDMSSILYTIITKGLGITYT